MPVNCNNVFVIKIHSRSRLGSYLIHINLYGFVFFVVIKFLNRIKRMMTYESLKRYFKTFHIT